VSLRLRKGRTLRRCESYVLTSLLHLPCPHYRSPNYGPLIVDLFGAVIIDGAFIKVAAVPMPHLVYVPAHTQGPVLAYVTYNTLPHLVSKRVAEAVISAADCAFGD
jgi:hypothetical protein